MQGGPQALLLPCLTSKPGPALSRGEAARHAAVLGLALVKRATPMVVDLVLALVLSRYLGVPVPDGTDRPNKGLIGTCQRQRSHRSYTPIRRLGCSWA
jgi:hypothetical protein